MTTPPPPRDRDLEPSPPDEELHLPSLGLPDADRPHLDPGLEDEEPRGLEDDDDAALAVRGWDDRDASTDDTAEDNAAEDVFPLALAEGLVADTAISSSALGDDAEGLGQLKDDGTTVSVAATPGSFLDDHGHAEEGMDDEASEALGIDPVPREEDDGGLEGLEDPGARVDAALFPPLDETDDDDEDQDVNVGDIALAPLPPLDRDDGAP
ncbi:MAG: hypothetical protein AAGN82_06360 [Myxococcota bacterium]